MNAKSSQPRAILLCGLLVFVTLSMPPVVCAQATPSPQATPAVASAADRPILTPKPGPAPKINGPSVYGCRPGRPFLYRIPCTGTRPIEFTAEGLPEGMTLDRNTGIIKGSVLRPPGTYTVALRAKNASGADEKPFKIVVGDTLALTPPMGWNTWYTYYYSLTQAETCKQADAMLASGMADFGYEYVGLDDCWMKKRGEEPHRDNKGDILPSDRFPDMRGLADYLHSKGLKAGIYTAVGPWTCAGHVASYKHEEQDVRQFAAWGYDFLKLDTCSYKLIVPEITVPVLREPFKKFGDALKEVDRDIVFNACPMHGKVAMDSWEWAAGIGANSWRTGNDVNNVPNAKLPGFFKNAEDNALRWEYAGPGHWNDPDYILIGYRRNSEHREQPPVLAPYTADEQYSYMSLWCLMAAPLCYSGDMTRLDEFTLNVLCNAEVIAIDQDPLGKQAKIVRKTQTDLVFAKPLEDGSLAVGLFNLDENVRDMQASWDELGIKGAQTARDLWRQRDLDGRQEGAFKASVPRHGVMLVRLRPAGG
jgi:alpha-galactosidase